MFNGKLIILSAPSGAGKTTLKNLLMSELPELSFSVSCTTRSPRKDEIQGEHYHYLTVEDFKQKIEDGQFAEWEEVYQGRFYGTLKSELERIWSLGKHIIFDIDVVGGLNLKKQYPEKALSIFIKPPSVEVLAERLKTRDTESEKELLPRIEKAKEELSFSEKFDTIILNDNLEKAQKELTSVVQDFLQK